MNRSMEKAVWRKLHAIPLRATARALILLAVAPLAAVVPGPVWAATPIANGTATTLPTYTGSPWKPEKVKVKKPPRNKFMAPNGRSNVHDDPWMSDVYWTKGPQGINPETLSSAIGAVCITITFDRKGRLVASCSSLFFGPRLYMLDPKTLDVLAMFPLPFVSPPAGQDPTTNSAGGVYFYLDKRGRVVISTTSNHIWRIAEAPRGEPLGFVLDHDWDLSGLLAADDRLTSALPDWSGRIWFVSRYAGVVGVLDPETGTIQSTTLNEEIENSFAVDEEGVYIVSDQRMYRFDLDGGGTPTVTWSQPYQNSGVSKPGQLNAGSGTTPTVLQGGYVAITDNADPMNVLVYRTAATLAAGQSRLVCEVPVFGAGASATENSLIGAGSSLIVENNYGYNVFDTINGAVSTPGFARVDLDEDGNGCHVVWTNNSEAAPSVVPKVSLKNGLVYTYTKAADPVNTTADAWFWTALDFQTGATVWKQLAGTGLNYNNHYAGIVLSKKGTAYLGAVGGLIAIRDQK
jgi:hypothetical protein